MQPYVFIGTEPRFYPNYEGHNVSVNPGDQAEFDVPPGDGNWVPAPTASATDDSWLNDTPAPAPQEKAAK